jgi:hypothetical protein
MGHLIDARENIHDRSWIRGAKGRPRVVRRESLCGRDVRASSKKSGKPRRWLSAEVVARGDRSHPGTSIDWHAVEDLQQVKLIEQIVFEPQHDLVDRRLSGCPEERALEHSIAVGQPAANRFR